MESNTKMEILFHQRGLFETDLNDYTILTFVETNRNDTILAIYEMDLEVITLLNEETRPCTDDRDYLLDICQFDFIYNVSYQSYQLSLIISLETSNEF